MTKKTTNIKEKVKTNYAKNPRATTSLGLVATAAIAALVGTLTGVIEPDAAMALFTKLLGALALGG